MTSAKNFVDQLISASSHDTFPVNDEYDDEISEIIPDDFLNELFSTNFIEDVTQILDNTIKTEIVRSNSHLFFFCFYVFFYF